jgi:hypothetical protein
MGAPPGETLLFTLTLFKERAAKSEESMGPKELKVATRRRE